MLGIMHCTVGGSYLIIIEVERQKYDLLITMHSGKSDYIITIYLFQKTPCQQHIQHGSVISGTLSDL